jgi:hypothetical protein
MPWRGHDALYCQICGRHRDEVGPLSARYKCTNCADQRQRENAAQLQARQGPYFRAWRRRMIASGIEWLVEAGEITEDEGQRRLEFHARSSGKRLPDVATARQRHVGVELSRHYRKAGNVEQGIFIASMNVLMQEGVPRLEAERLICENSEDFTPLRT